MARCHARYAAQQQATATMRFFEMGCTGLNRHTAGHLAHRRQKRQTASGPGDRFIRYAYRT